MALGKRFTIRLTAEELAELRRQAAEQGLTLAQFLRQMVHEKRMKLQAAEDVAQ